MASQALYRKWRPQTFDDVSGQGHVTQTLRNALVTDRIAHAYLFAGPRGTGKTTTARLLAKAVNCLDETLARRPCNECRVCVAINEGRLLDLIEIDAASNTGVDDIRDLRDKVGFRPGEARIKFYIIDEVHMLSNSAFNALLKTLEEPPAHVIFVLATTEPEKIPATVTSRCQRFDFRRIGLHDVVARLQQIVAAEGLVVDEAALEFMARQGNGSMRDAISLLDQIAAYGSTEITLEQVQGILGTVATQSVVELVDCLVKRDVAGGVSVINEVINDGVESRQFTRDIVEYLRALLLVKVGQGADVLNLPGETVSHLQTQAAQIDTQRLIQAAHLFSQAIQEIRHGVLSIPQLPLELAFVEATSEPLAGRHAAPQPAAAQPAVTSPAPAAPAPAAAQPVSKPVAAPPQPAAPPARSASGDFGLDAVLAQWADVLATIRTQNKMAYGLFNSGKPVAVQENRVVLSFQSDLLKSRAEQPRHRAIAEEAFRAVMGQTTALQFVVGEVSAPAAPEAEEAAAEASAEPPSVEDDPLVKAALDLGGQIVDPQSTHD